MNVLKSSCGCVGGYKSNFFVAYPSDMVILPNLQLMFTLVVANDGHSKMIG